MTYFVASLQTIRAEVGTDLGLGGTALSMLRSPQSPPMESILAVLINEVASAPDRIVMVLDDYHVIETRAIHDFLTFLLDHLPTQMHLVIASRTDPPLPLPRLRIRGELKELREADLRFRSNEIATLFNRVLDLKLSDEDIESLGARTEGWIAGLQVAALSMRDSKEVAGFIKAFTGSHRYVLDYLVDEVFDQQPPHVQEFLLQTAILNRLTGPLCDAVTGQANGQTTLAELERANLFIVPLDNERQWYRYHHLFAELLRVRLKADHFALIPTLHQRAAAWYESNEQFTEAINHYLKAADFQAVAQLIEKRYHAFIVRGDYMTLRRWIESLPGEFVSNRPRLSIAYAWSLLNETDTEVLDAPLENVIQALAKLSADRTDQDPALQGELVALQAFQTFYRNDIKRSIKLSRQALAQLPPEQRQVRGFLALNLANAHGVLGQLDDAIYAYEQVITASRQAGNVSAALIALGYLGEMPCMVICVRPPAPTGVPSGWQADPMAVSILWLA